ncbi:MAG: DUF4402 domain-containing protein [Erythrobacter sp.]
MFRVLHLTLAIIGLAMISLPMTGFPGQGASLRAQGNCPNCDLPPGCRGNGNQKPDKPPKRNCQRLEIAIESDLDFGRVVLLGNGEGRVLLDLATGQKRLFGDVDDLGGIPVTGRVLITGAPHEQVVIDLPGEIGMRDPSGGSAWLRDFETDLPPFPRLDSGGRLTFAFSGTLVIAAETQASGNLRGRVPITVEYP